MIRRPPRSTRTDTLFPYTTLFRSDYWNERLEDWLYTEAGAFTERFGVDGYYVRIAPSGLQAGLCGRIDVRNRSGRSILAIALIGMDYLYLPRLGLRDARDPRIQNTLKVSEGVLRVETPHGIRSEERRVGKECVSTLRS